MGNVDRDTFSPSEVLEALKDKFDIASNIVTVDMRDEAYDSSHMGHTLQVTGCFPAPVIKPRQLKRLGQLKGLTIESIKTVKSGSKTYIKTTDGAGMCLLGATPKQDLAPDENIALGLLTKEDLASIAKAKKMGLI